MSLQQEFEKRVTRLPEDSRIVRIHDWADARFFLQRRELQFNAMVFSRPLTAEERRDADDYIRTAQRTMVAGKIQNFRSVGLSGYFDKAARRLVPDEVKSLPLSDCFPDITPTFLKEEGEQGLSSRLQNSLMHLTRGGYDIIIPDESEKVKEIRRQLQKAEEITDKALYLPYSSMLRINSSIKSDKHTHPETMIWAMVGKGPVCYDEYGNDEVFQPEEGDILIHDEDFWHGAPPQHKGDRLTYISGLGW